MYIHICISSHQPIKFLLVLRIRMTMSVRRRIVPPEHAINSFCARQMNGILERYTPLRNTLFRSTFGLTKTIANCRFRLPKLNFLRKIELLTRVRCSICVFFFFFFLFIFSACFSCAEAHRLKNMQCRRG